MKKYLYYPGCSLHSTGRAYEESMLSVFQFLDIQVEELHDWNCCGATSYASIDEMQSFSLAARNLAIAEKQQDNNGDIPHVIAPCNACYLVLTKTQKYMDTYPHVKNKVDKALDAAGMHYHGKAKVRHPLDVIVHDVGIKTVAEKIIRNLKGLKVACYYGCQVVRPFAEFDDQHNPMTMDKLVTAMGGEAVDWPLKTFCCGGSLTGTISGAGLPLNRSILLEAKKRGAEMIITCCPLCQFNLECFQDRINAAYDEHIHIPVLYFTQLMGIAFGLPEEDLGIQRLFIKPAFRSSETKGGVKVHA